MNDKVKTQFEKARSVIIVAVANLTRPQFREFLEEMEDEIAARLDEIREREAIDRKHEAEQD